MPPLMITVSTRLIGIRIFKVLKRPTDVIYSARFDLNLMSENGASAAAICIFGLFFTTLYSVAFLFAMKLSEKL